MIRDSVEMVSLSTNLTVALCHFCEHHGPSVVFHTRLKQPSERLTKSIPSNNCVACNPLGSEHPGFTSQDPESEFETVSSNQCLESNAFKSRLHQAAFRSLSSEVTPNKEGPIFFSDSGIGINVISHTFFLKDSSARGFQRWFSVIILCLESASLLALWSFLLPEIREIIKELQELATIVYQAEEQTCSHRLLRTNLNNFNVGAARALQDLTGSSNVLLNLHTKFSHIILSATHPYSSTALEICRSQETDEELYSVSSVEQIQVLLKICSELGESNFRRLIKHVLQGGIVNISSDNLTLNCTFVESLQLLLPITNSSFKIANHKLQETTQPCLMITDKGQKLVCVWNTCPPYGKVSCIVTQLEHILFAEEIPPSFVVLQLSRILNQVMVAAKKLRTLNQPESDTRQVLQFFQSYGFDSGDIDILNYWSTQT